jgi:exosortase D (VPLPA-CTERM-specific)
MGSLNKNSSTQTWWLPGVLVLSCLVFSYWSTIQGLVRQWLNSEDYSYGLLIGPIAAYLIWQKRSELKKANIQSDWRAIIVLILAIFVFIVGELGAELFTTRVSMLIFIIGLTWFLYGYDVFKLLRFPLAFLFLMLPLPGFVARSLTFPLQLSASIGSVNLLHSLGVSVYREGNVIDLGFTQLQVVEACNGLRYILPLFTLGVLFAYVGQKVHWKRIVLVIATVPIAIFANVTRVAGTGLIGVYWGEKAAEGFFHSFSGLVVFMLCIASFCILNAALNLLPDTYKEKENGSMSSIDSKHRRAISWPSSLLAMATVLATPAIVAYLGQVPPVPAQQPVASFPVRFEGWSGTKSEMDPEIWEQVGGQDYTNIDYYKKNESPVNFYVAYYESQRKGGKFVHTPRLCLVGGGSYVEEDRVRQLSQNMNSSGPALKLNELVISKNGMKQLVYFWYQGRGRNFTSEWAAKFYMVWDGLCRRRTDGALVRLMTPLRPGETPADGRRIMDPFALAVSRALRDYLP